MNYIYISESKQPHIYPDVLQDKMILWLKIQGAKCIFREYDTAEDFLENTEGYHGRRFQAIDGFPTFNDRDFLSLLGKHTFRWSDVNVLFQSCDICDKTIGVYESEGSITISREYAKKMSRNDGTWRPIQIIPDFIFRIPNNHKKIYEIVRALMHYISMPIQQSRRNNEIKISTLISHTSMSFASVKNGDYQKMLFSPVERALALLKQNGIITEYSIEKAVGDIKKTKIRYAIDPLFVANMQMNTDSEIVQADSEKVYTDSEKVYTDSERKYQKP